jgi:hypothetical protein
MTGEVDQISNVAGDVTESSSHSDAGTKSEVTSSTYYSTMVDQAIANKAVPLLYQYWKAPMVTDKPTMLPVGSLGCCSVSQLPWISR